jgi:hypothetical protein
MNHITPWLERMPEHYGDGAYLYLQKQAMQAEIDELRAALAQPVMQALTDPENQPNQFGVEFGMRGPRMFFTIGNQSFDLAYEPEEPEEFEFMKRMLCSAFSAFTPDVKSEPSAVSGWKPIKSAPKDGTEILLGHPDGSLCVGWWKPMGRSTGWTDGDTFNMSWPLYWQPRPTAPTGEHG